MEADVISSRYYGLCLGGPFDGKFATSDHDRLEGYLPLAAPELLYSATVDALGEVIPDRYVYQHVQFWFRKDDHPGHEERRGFWIHIDHRWPQLAVLDHLAMAYRHRAS